MTLTNNQFRVRKATIEQVRLEIEDYSLHIAQLAKEDAAFSLAYQFAHALDKATIQHFQDQPMDVPALDQLWANFVSRSVPGNLSLEPLEDHRVLFSLYLVNGDVLGRVDAKISGWRRSWMMREGVERYGRLRDADAVEERRRINDWSAATYGHEVTAFDGVVERPTAQEVHAQIPSLQSRANGIAVRVFENQVRARLLRPGHTPEEWASASVEINRHLDTPEGQAEFKDLRKKIEGILLPNVSIDLIENGIHTPQASNMRLS